jgi:hypothetical protein
MRRALGIALKALKWIAIVGCTALAIVVVINLHDEELTPEAQALAEFHRPTIPDAQNAYLALVGFDAPSGGDPIATGAQMVKEFDAAAADDPTGAVRIEKMSKGAAPWPWIHEGGLIFVGDTSGLCDPISKPCLRPPFDDAGKLRALADGNKELIARYLAIQKMTAYANPSAPDPLNAMLSGSWGGPRSLLLTQASLDGLSGKEDRALAFLAADMRFWRGVLGAGGMIDEMRAARVLASDFALLSELIAMDSFDVRGRETTLRQMLAPLSPAETNSAPMFKREFEMVAKWLTTTQEGPLQSEDVGWLSGPLNMLLFKKKASLNESARLYAELQGLASRPPADFAELSKKVRVQAYAMSEPGVKWLYNPVGKTLVGSGIGFYPDFVARVFDLAAYSQLVRAQLEVRLANLAPDKVATFLASAGSEMRNPYTGQPFNWDAANRSLSFEPMYKRAWPGWKFRATVPLPASPR